MESGRSTLCWSSQEASRGDGSSICIGPRSSSAGAIGPCSPSIVIAIAVARCTRQRRVWRRHMPRHVRALERRCEWHAHFAPPCWKVPAQGQRRRHDHRRRYARRAGATGGVDAVTDHHRRSADPTCSTPPLLTATLLARPDSTDARKSRSPLPYGAPVIGRDKHFRVRAGRRIQIRSPRADA